jgi:phosphomethylpyrimidine synthase
MMARTFLSRRSLGEGGCSMKITKDVRKFAGEQKISEEQALQVGLEQKAKEFADKGAEVYAKA